MSVKKIYFLLVSNALILFVSASCLAQCQDSDGVEGSQNCAASKENRSNNSFFKESCTNWALLPYGDYVVQNNVWNGKAMYKKDYSLCISLTGDEKNPVPRWKYDFLREEDGEIYAVKSYPQVYYGQKRQAIASGKPSKLGLPKPLPQLENFKVKYKYSENGKGERNVALESFFHTSCDILPENKEFELMIWVGKPERRTGGTDKVGEALVDGAKWDIWLNKNLSWGYVAFVRQEPSNEGTIHWKKFIDWTMKTGPSMGVAKINPNSCMNAIELGTEIFSGSGEFVLEEFKVERY